MIKNDCEALKFDRASRIAPIEHRASGVHRNGIFDGCTSNDLIVK